jgi:hypothetical protein
MRNQMAPDRKSAEQVFITVSGGVAYVAQAPETVNVHIIDYDELKADFEPAFLRLSPEAQAFCRQSDEFSPGTRSSHDE